MRRNQCRGERGSSPTIREGVADRRHDAVRMVRANVDGTKHISAILADGSYGFLDDRALPRIQSDLRIFELSPIRVFEGTIRGNLGT